MDDLFCVLESVLWPEVKYEDDLTTSCLFSALIIFSCFDYHIQFRPLPGPGAGMCRSESNRSKSVCIYKSVFPEESTDILYPERSFLFDRLQERGRVMLAYRGFNLMNSESCFQ